jgi:hypothetical protein
VIELTPFIPEFVLLHRGFLMGMTGVISRAEKTRKINKFPARRKRRYKI